MIVDTDNLRAIAEVMMPGACDRQIIVDAADTIDLLRAQLYLALENCNEKDCFQSDGATGPGSGDTR